MPIEIIQIKTQKEKSKQNQTVDVRALKQHMVTIHLT